MRALYFAAGLLIGVYGAAWILDRFPSVFPEPFPDTRTATDGRVWQWQATSPPT